MHELGIVFHVIRAVENIGREQGLTDVASVTLELGQVSGVVPHELESCWKWAADTVPESRTCPYCGSEDTWLVQGNEVNIKEIEAQ